MQLHFDFINRDNRRLYLVKRSNIGMELGRRSESVPYTLMSTQCFIEEGFVYENADIK